MESFDTIGILGFATFLVIILGIISVATKPKHVQKINPSGALNKTRKRSKRRRRRHLRGKHEFVHRPSLLDSGMAIVVPWRGDAPRSKIMQQSVFRGWYNLCWLIGSAYLLQYVMNNYRQKGSLIGNFDWFYSLFHYLHELLLVLLPVYALSFSAFFLEKLMAQQIFGQKYTRTILHSVQHFIQTVMIFGVGMFVFFFCEHWPFTQKFALTLETMCLYMKMHSYMLSNQELYEMKYGLKHHKKTDSASTSTATATHSDDFNIHTVEDVDEINDEQVKQELAARGLRDFSAVNIQSTSPANFCYYVQDDTQVNIYGFSSCYKNRSTRVFESDKPGSNTAMSAATDQNGAASVSTSSVNSEASLQLPPTPPLLTAASSKVFKLHEEIEKLQQIESAELEKAYMKMVLKDSVFLENYRKQIYPQNVTLYNWVEFTFFPTLVYEPLYPRTASVRIIYIVEKIGVIFSVMGFMFAILEQFMLQKLSKGAQLEPIQTIINLLVPATLLEICGFFVVFDCMLNCIAEITCFADREFYQDWWNSTSFEEFARKWNRPVHEFLLRHVYYESMSTYKLSKNVALAGTFVFSIALHEVVLCACLHKFSPWLAFMSLFQLPLMPVMSAPVFKNKPLGNIVFWVGIIIGMPMTCVLYAREYCTTYDCSIATQS